MSSTLPLLSSPLPTLTDLTHPVGEKTVAWPTATPFTVSNAVAAETEAGYWYEGRDFSQESDGG